MPADAIGTTTASPDIAPPAVQRSSVKAAPAASLSRPGALGRFGSAATRGEGRHRHGLVEMELAGSAVIVEPVGEVEILLDLDQRDAAADGVDRAGGRIEDVALAHRPPVEQPLDAAVERGGAQRVARDLAGQPEPDHGARLGVDHEPGLVLAAGHSPSPAPPRRPGGPGSTAAPR